jgi:methyl-accepting chemotaxis protein
VQLVGDTGQALSGIVGKVAEIDTLISEIAQSSQEQATGLNQVNTAVNQMDQVTQQNAAMVEQATAAAANLKSESGALAGLVIALRDRCTVCGFSSRPSRSAAQNRTMSSADAAIGPAAPAQLGAIGASLVEVSAEMSSPTSPGRRTRICLRPSGAMIRAVIASP